MCFLPAQYQIEIISCVSLCFLLLVFSGRLGCCQPTYCTKKNPNTYKSTYIIVNGTIAALRRGNGEWGRGEMRKEWENTRWIQSQMRGKGSFERWALQLLSFLLLQQEIRTLNRGKLLLPAENILMVMCFPPAMLVRN